MTDISKIDGDWVYFGNETNARVCLAQRSFLYCRLVCVLNNYEATFCIFVLIRFCGEEMLISIFVNKLVMIGVNG